MILKCKYRTLEENGMKLEEGWSLSDLDEYSWSNDISQASRKSKISDREDMVFRKYLINSENEN